jgi:signal transduction histidine kinase
MPKRRWGERTRMLAFQLAVGLPAIALIVFNIVHLHSIQRDQAIEAAITRDSQQMLAITEKHMATHAYELIEVVRREFPGPDDAVKPALTKLLASHPYAMYLLLYDEHKGIVVVAPPERLGDPSFKQNTDKFANIVVSWMSGKEVMRQLWDADAANGHPYRFFPSLGPVGTVMPYTTLAVFPLPGVDHSRVALGGIAFDPEYLKSDFFPAQLNEMAAGPANRRSDQGDFNRVALMLHLWNQAQPLAASMNWDDGKPEVERRVETVFTGLVLAIKFHGTTIQALGQRFLRINYIILGCLSVLLVGGIMLTYRNVNREMLLARLKSDFVSNVSHELRTPLSLIRLYAETLELGRIKHREKFQEYYCIIRKESERLSGLINNILDFSRIEAGKKEYDFRETDLAELVQATVDSYRYQIELNGFAYEQHIEEDLPKLHVDREAIARSLLNLMNNAFKYSADNKYLGINLYRCNGSVRMEVVDRGIGISRSDQTRIFEKFYRASDPLVHNSKGSGLGLSLVRHVVEAHHGKVFVDSTPGQGSTFTIVLPLAPEQKTEKAGIPS